MCIIKLILAIQYHLYLKFWSYILVHLDKFRYEQCKIIKLKHIKGIKLASLSTAEFLNKARSDENITLKLTSIFGNWKNGDPSSHAADHDSVTRILKYN